MAELENPVQAEQTQQTNKQNKQPNLTWFSRVILRSFFPKVSQLSAYPVCNQIPNLAITVVIQSTFCTHLLNSLAHAPWLLGSGKRSLATKCITVVLPSGNCNAARKDKEKLTNHRQILYAVSNLITYIKDISAHTGHTLQRATAA